MEFTDRPQEGTAASLLIPHMALWVVLYPQCFKCKKTNCKKLDQYRILIILLFSPAVTCCPLPLFQKTPPIKKKNLVPLFCGSLPWPSALRSVQRSHRRSAGPPHFLYSVNGGRVKAMFLQYGQQQEQLQVGWTTAGTQVLPWRCRHL